MAKTRTIDIGDTLVGVGLTAASANVIMQLARPGVGYGVLESSVESGKVYVHPIKRLRTTVTYLMVAAVGTEAERAAYRDAVNGQHRAVRSGPNSAVKYNAFDTDLQLWVAACLYKGLVDVCGYLYPPISEENADQLYRDAARLGTTLQMPESMWPADRAEFDRYWKESLAKVSIDPPVREYLDGIASNRVLPKPFHPLVGSVGRFFTRGFLPPEFRAEMGYRWTDREQRRFEAAMKMLAIVNRLLPRPLRALPGSAYLWDMRRRISSGQPLV